MYENEHLYVYLKCQTQTNIQKMAEPIVKLPTIPENIFKNLLKYLECDEQDIDGTIGFKAEASKYYLNFYGCADDDFRLAIDQVVRIKSDIEEFTTTPEQREIMQNLLYKKAEELEAEQIEEVKDDWLGWGDMSETYKFIESNFYTAY